MKIFLYGISVILYLFILCLHGYSQNRLVENDPEELRFDRLTTSQGLSQATVNTILQDSEGYMWFATRDGLNKYDGYTFTVYRNDPTNLNSLSSSHVRGLVEDANKILWIATNGGLNRLELKTGRFTSYQHHVQNQNSLSDNHVSAVSMDKAGMLWIGTEDGLNKFDPETSQFTRFLHDPLQKNSLTDNDIYDLHLDRNDGTLWIATAAGLDHYNPKTNTFQHILSIGTNDDPAQSYKVIEVYQDRSGMIWAGIDGMGLIRYDPASGKQTRFVHNPADPFSISSNNITAVFEDSQGQLWMGAWPGGLNKFNPASQTFTVYRHEKSNPSSISDDHIKTIYEDPSGMLWFGTFNAGINMYDRVRNTFKLYTHMGENATLSQGQVHALLEDHLQNIWVGSENILVRLDRKTGRKVTYVLNDPSVIGINKITVYSLFQDKQGIIWVGSRGKGLGKYIPEADAFQWYQHDSLNTSTLSHNIVTVIREDSMGVLWISTNNGLNRFDPITGKFTRYLPEKEYLDKEGRFGISGIHMGRSGMIWIASAKNGIASFDPNTGLFTHHPYKTKKANILINSGTHCIYEDRKGFIWIGFIENVLHQFNPHTGIFTPITHQEGLPTTKIRAIMEDNSGNLWVTTRSNGLYSYNPQSRSARHYDKRNGLQGDEFLGAFYKNKRGEMYFGGKDGFNIFQPDSIKANPYVPPVVISSFKVFNSPRAYADSIITLSHDENFFSFEYVGLSYSLPEENTYQYQLEGVDESWTEAGNRRFVSYTNLDPGEYKFRVKAANYDGVWNQVGASVTIRIIPPIWLQRWFQITAVFICCLLGYVWYKSRVYTIKSRNRHLEQLVAQRTEELRQRSLQLEQSLTETLKQQQEAEYQRQRAEEANRLKTELTNLTVHDLKNPLGGIMLYSDLIKESVSDPEKIVRLSQTVKDISKQMFHLLSNLLKRAKLENNYISLQKDKIDIALLVRSVVDRNQLQAIQKGQNLFFQETSGHEVEIDVELMNDALENLISNAIKFTPSGKNIWIGIEASQDQVKIYFKDEGLGIQPEEMQHLFAPFQRLSSRPTGNESSTGLGLFIVKRIIELHQGEITVESGGSHNGSTFTIVLPLSPVNETVVAEENSFNQSDLV